MRALLLVLLVTVTTAAQTAQPDLALPLGPARVHVDLYSPAQAIRVDGLPAGTVSACTLFASVDELLEGEPYVPRHCWFSDDFAGGYAEDWAFIPPGHVYVISVEYQVAGAGDVLTAFRTPAVSALRVEWQRKD